MGQGVFCAQVSRYPKATIALASLTQSSSHSWEVPARARSIGSLSFERPGMQDERSIRRNTVGLQSEHELLGLELRLSSAPGAPRASPLLKERQVMAACFARGSPSSEFARRP